MNPILVPERFREKIARVFGATGSEWLRGLDNRVEAAAGRWQLQNLQLAPVLSYNLLCFAESQAYGPVAMKLGVPNPELFSEMEALDCYGGRGICRCHESDRELGALLLERILPGDDLHTLPDWRERIRIAAGLIGSLPVPAPARHGFPTYGEQMARAFARVRREGLAGERLLGLVETAAGLFRAIDRPELPPVLLHGDLHHANILRDRQGRWKAIDPKGIIGPARMEPARFIENELERGEQPAAAIIRLMAEALGERPERVAVATFVDKVLSTCWCLEESVAPEELAAAVQSCEEILKACGQEPPD